MSGCTVEMTLINDCYQSILDYILTCTDHDVIGCASQTLRFRSNLQTSVPTGRSFQSFCVYVYNGREFKNFLVLYCNACTFEDSGGINEFELKAVMSSLEIGYGN